MVAAMRVADVIGGDTDPLVIVLGIAADTKQPVELRLGACALAIPVMYPRLSATTVQASPTVTRIEASELLDKIADRIAKQVPHQIEGEATDASDGAEAA
jgi:hypothetical protein